MKIDKQQFQTWMTALRSGEYPQGRASLQTIMGYCCLGVGCKVLIPEDELVLHPDNRLRGLLPSQQKNAPEWLKNINSDFLARTGKALSGLNDLDGLSHNEMADLLEAVYIHHVLGNKYDYGDFANPKVFKPYKSLDLIK